jgi:hypothetical protein
MCVHAPEAHPARTHRFCVLLPVSSTLRAENIMELRLIYGPAVACCTRWSQEVCVCVSVSGRCPIVSDAVSVQTYALSFRRTMTQRFIVGSSQRYVCLPVLQVSVSHAAGCVCVTRVSEVFRAQH